MIISDLNYLENISESSNIVGGGRKHPKKSKFTLKLNYSDIDQKVEAYAIAVNLGKGGQAYAYNEISQSATVYQEN